MRLTDGSTLTTNLDVPDVIPAIVLKAYAFEARRKLGDALDLWKLFEVAHSLDLHPDAWPARATTRDALKALHTHLVPPSSLGANLARRQRWPHARIAALVKAHTPPPT
ncbi:hypothetical protein MWU75_00080 [Ornithinimicrobium sp. F0845]|uniref:hypothetical protein n=1 Tax=Ornithinimicrobium sp. F0845 TaxID=2926412 RepID=UPI001FF2D1D2|nr:hypothetical protein [Ornithinimicrobium sp. F0845]MCK0110546.1 hypothetical protein [Ornithinimicrobium sp. F0845]